MFVGTLKVTVTCWNDLAQALQVSDLIGQVVIIFGGIVNRWNSSVSVNLFSIKPVVIPNFNVDDAEVKNSLIGPRNQTI